MAVVLVVDDDADTREALCRYLRKAGYLADCVSNGRDALVSVLAHPPDVLVVDLFMPEMDGTYFVEVIRSYLRVQSLPVIIWTGAPENHPRLDLARELKVSDVLIKPVASFLDIRRAIERALQPPPQHETAFPPSSYLD